MLTKALEKNGLKISDVKLVNVPTHQTAQTLASGSVDAIGAWQPNAGQALKAAAGLEGDLHQRRPARPHLRPRLRQPAEPVAAARRLGRSSSRSGTASSTFVRDPANQAEAVKIMAGRAGVPAEEYAKYMPGTQLPLARGGAHALRAEGHARVALRQRQGRRRLQRRQQGLREAAAGRDLHRRLAVEGSAREVGAARRGRAAPPCAEPGRGRSPGSRPARAAVVLGGVVPRRRSRSGARSATCRSSGTRWCGSSIPATAPG